MSIRFELRDDNARATRFVTAPLVEATAALNALLFPGERPLQHTWIRSMRSLPVGLRREIRAFGFVLDHAFPDCVLPTATRTTEVAFDKALAGLARLEPVRAAYELTRPAFAYVLADAPADEGALELTAVREQIALRARPYGPAAVTLARQAVGDPAAFRDRFVGLLASFWEESFEQVWRSLGPQLARIARRDARLSATRGVYSVLDGRFAGLVIDREAGWFERRSDHHHVVRPTRANPVVFVPSVFVWPYVRVNCDPPWPLAVVYPPADVVAEASLERSPDGLDDVLAALADPARLQILRALAERPRPTQELAPLLRLGEPAVSRHLRVLSEAGLVESVRDGRYVLYRVLPERLETSLEALREHVVRPGLRRRSLHRGSTSS